MAILSKFDAPFFTGTTATAPVPHPWHVALAGHPYMLSTDPVSNEKYGARFQQVSLPLLKDQADQEKLTGEQSVSPSILWRRSIESWHLGCGQTQYDTATSSPFRFNTSLGADVWTQGQLKCLNDTSNLNFSNTFPVITDVHTPYVQAAGGRLYFGVGLGSAGNMQYWTAAGFVGSANGTSVTGLGAVGGTLQGMCSDGLNVYASYGASGIYTTNTGTSAAASYVTGTTGVVGFAKGRLIASDGSGKLCNPTNAIGVPAALPTALIDLTSRGWVWTGIGEGPTCIYATGFSGDQSAVYAITVKSDGTGLNVPFLAVTLPTGEIARSVYGYTGFVLIGTDKGVRCASADSSGNLTLGPLLPVGPVYAFDGQDRFVWFTWSNYDTTHTGLGRLDLSNFTAPLTPAYATDLQATSVFAGGAGGAAPVTSLSGWQGLHFFPVTNGSNLYVASEYTPHKVQAVLDTGRITYGVGDAKAAQFVDLFFDPLPLNNATVGVAISADGGVFRSLANTSTPSAPTSGSLNAGGASATGFNLKLTVSPDAAFVNAPVFHRVTLRSVAQPARVTEWNVPLLLHTDVEPEQGIPRHVDVGGEYDFLMGLYYLSDPVAFQIGTRSYQVLLYDTEWLPSKITADGQAWQGTFIAKLRDVRA